MQKDNGTVSRRKAMKGLGVAGATAYASLGSNFASAQGSEELKVGVIGAGGRASGAVANHVEAAEIAGMKVKIVSICDMFQDRADSLAKKYKVAKDKSFSGFDGYKAVIDSGVDAILTATPPGMRPIHFVAAIEAGKHIFFEKPVAVDPVGVRKVIAASKLANEKKLCVVAGTQRRHESNYINTIERIHEGVIGDVMHMSVYWNGEGIWWKKREAGMSDMEYQIHNWYHHIWLCGDQICEQHIHNLDVANWVMKGPPVSALAMGGRQVRKDPGEIWDHFAVEYEYANGGRVMSQCRHWPDSTSNVSEFAIGTKGTANPGGQINIRGGETLKFKNERSGYVQEHVDFLNAIKSGKQINEGEQVAHSTLTAIMGRMSAYTGKKVSWDFALNKSKLDTLPAELSKDAKAPQIIIPEPGVTKLI